MNIIGPKCCSEKQYQRFLQSLRQRGYLFQSDSLQEKNSLPQDGLVWFNQRFHRYIYLNKTQNTTVIPEEGSENLYFDVEVVKAQKSVTGSVKKSFPPFEAQKISRRLAQKKFKDENKIQVYSQQLQKKWQWSREDGVRFHDCIYRYYTQGQEKKIKENISHEWIQFLEFAQDMKVRGWLPFRCEMPVFDTEEHMAGMIDMIFYHPIRKLYRIYDWKRSKKIWKTAFGGRTGLNEYSDLPDSNFYHYSLQLSWYRYILEKFNDLTVESCWIVIFHPDNNVNGSYYLKEFGCPEVKSYKEIRCPNLLI